MGQTLKDEDGVTRCAWAAATAEYRSYHDEEWGHPVTDDRQVFETLCLEGFQAGLSWLTILRKRTGLRHAFADFAPQAIARFDEHDVERLLGDPAIVRHRAKIRATLTNARAALRLADAGISLAALCWSYEPPERQDADAVEVPASTPASRALSAELRRHGFAFVGPTTVYSAMQALGIVNDHLSGCALRSVVARKRAALDRPRPPRGAGQGAERAPASQSGGRRPK
jgi:DNA-3-methyladenine glycosylase I